MPGAETEVREGAIDFAFPTRVVFGVNSVDGLGDYVRELGAGHVYLVTDAGVEKAGHAERVRRVLQASKIEVHTFADARGNPTTVDVQTALDALGDFPADLILGLGGGSSLDVAKGCNFLRAGGGPMEDYWGMGKARGTMVPMIMVPTTAGTGSETQSFALIGQAESHQKMACGDPQAAAKIAVLDPTLTVTLPREVTAMTGLDTIGHAVESAVTTRRNVISDMFAASAFEFAHRNLPRAMSHPDDLEAREAMLRASAYGGIAIEHSMLGAAHSLANPLTARCGLAHGHAVGLMLPHVVRFNAEDDAVAARYAEFVRMAHLCPFACPDPAAVGFLIQRLDEVLAATGLPRHLTGLGVSADLHASLAEEAAQQWTAQFNPRKVAVADFQTLLAMAS